MFLQKVTDNNLSIPQRADPQRAENVTPPALPLEIMVYILEYLDNLGLQLMIKVSHALKNECLHLAKKRVFLPLDNMFLFLSRNIKDYVYDCDIQAEINPLDNLLDIRQATDPFKEKILEEMKKLSQDELAQLDVKAKQDMQIHTLFEEYKALLKIYQKLEVAATSNDLSEIVCELLNTKHLHHKAKKITATISDPEQKIAAQEKVFLTFIMHSNFCQALAIFNEMQDDTYQKKQGSVILMRKLILHVYKKLADECIEKLAAPMAIRGDLSRDLFLCGFVTEGLEVASDISPLPENVLSLCSIVEDLLKMGLADEAERFIMNSSWDSATKSNILAGISSYYFQREEFDKMSEIIGKMPDIEIQAKLLEAYAQHGINLEVPF